MVKRTNRYCLLSVCPLLVLVLLLGCDSSPETYDNAGANEAANTFSGPRYLRGTVGSYGSFINNTPRYVGGYGMVVDLNGTGSNEVPGFMRDWLVNEMLRNNLGSVQFGTESFGPERVMADLGSSVVAVEGLIPPGATRGSKFDILVTMVDQTSTSLSGGRLFWPTQLAPMGLDRRLIYTETQATGYGELFVNPVAPPGDEGAEFLRQAVVVNGGTVLESQKVQFVLNQPSYRIANLIADRVNGRFEALDSDTLPTAVAKSDGLIEINVPDRFASQPDELLALVEHLYLDPTPQFVKPQAQALADSLVQDAAERARPVTLAWKGLGPNATPVLRQYYAHPDAAVRGAALEAGAWLNDKKVLVSLKAMAQSGDAKARVRAARSLVAMTRNQDARSTVQRMLNDDDPEVRLGAYEALAMVKDRSIRRLSVHDGNAHKFFIDQVPSKHAYVYALQGADQSIVIFGDDIPLRKNLFSKIDNSITLQSVRADSIPVGLSGRYEGDSAFVPIHRCGAIQMIPSLTPVSEEPGAKLPPPDWRVEIGDGEGNSMQVNIRDQKLQDAFGVKLLAVPDRNKASEKPRLVGVVRVVKAAGKDQAGKPTPAVGELLALRDPDLPMPLAMRYQPSGKEAKFYRVQPTVATLAYTLGYKRDNLNTQLGPDLGFSYVVRALHTLARQGQIPAPFDARISPLAQRIASSQRDDQTQARPEITPEELQRLQEGQPDPPATEPATTEPGANPAANAGQ